MKKYVIDTSVLLHDPNSINKFEENEVILPFTVITELDTFKDGSSGINQNAREVIRKIEDIRKSGSLTEGGELPSGGILSTYYDRHLDYDTADDRIIEVADETESVLVTKDLNMRIRADALGVKVEDYKAMKTSVSESDVREIYVSDGDINSIHSGEGITLMDMGVNEHAEVIAGGGGGPTLIRQHPDGKCYSSTKGNRAWGLKARNREQHFALDVLTDKNISLVVLSGKAGTGKTLISLAAGLEAVMGEGSPYERLLVSRPVVPMGNDLGYIPGTIEEKMEPWLKPIDDSLEFLSKGNEYSSEDLHAFGKVEVEPLTYIRGRSIPNQFMIIDEAQNLTPHEIKTIITRAGEGTKIVLTGDPYQIDSPYLDESSNALSYVSERMAGESMFADVHLVKGERSPLAEAASELL